jgi:hypothetical protein
VIPGKQSKENNTNVILRMGEDKGFEGFLILLLYTRKT